MGLNRLVVAGCDVQVVGGFGAVSGWDDQVVAGEGVNFFHDIFGFSGWGGMTIQRGPSIKGCGGRGGEGCNKGGLTCG